MKEKLIELLCNAHGMATDASLFEDASYAQMLETEADHLIANGVTIQKWIPVTERLPDRNGVFLVCAKHDFYKTEKVAKATFKKHSRGFYGQGGHWSNVTHWMPLPEAPKGAD